jgi:ubiquinone/menaquinone biosynthesis C-methylase UbiE
VEVNTMTELARRPAAVVYDRVAGIYDLYTAPMEAFGGRRARQRLFGRARARVLELGIGTGLSLPSYPPGAELTGIDISPRMLARARRRAERMGLKADLEVADVERLPFPDGSFDTVTAACVFCSVGDPVRGLQEAARVTRPGGQVLLYEHVRPRNPVLGKLTDLVSPLTRRLFGPELNRPTERNVETAGLRITEVRRHGIWREIIATPRRP